MDDFDKYLLNCVKLNTLSLDNYTQLNNTNLLNIKKSIDILKNYNNDIHLKTLFNERYNQLIKYDPNESICDNIIFKNKIILKRLLKQSNLTYTNDQQNALDNVIRFLTDEQQKIFGLFGYAGTGKTTTIIDFIINSIELKYINSVVFSAPTNKALNVIKTKISDQIKFLLHKYNIDYNNNSSFDMNVDKLKKKNITIEFQTIHKLLKFKSEYNMEGEITFTKDKDNVIEGYDIIIVDECSMIPLGLIYEIIKESGKTKTKIIFTGDPAQLPPVNEKISTIFMTQTNKISFNKLKLSIPNITYEQYNKFCDTLLNMNNYILKEIVRTKHTGVISCSNTIRDCIHNIKDFTDIIEYSGSNVQLYSYDKTQKIKTDWYKEFERQLKIEKDTIIIAWTNDEVNYYNNYIRKSVFQNKVLSEYEINDILILNEFYIMDNAEDITNNKASEQQNKVKFNTSEKIVVTNIEDGNYIIGKLSTKTNTNLKIFQNHRSIETKYRNFVNRINSMEYKFKIHKMKVKKIDDADNEYKINVLFQDELIIHKKLIIQVIEEIKKFRTEMINTYQLISIDTSIIQPLYNDFYTKFINIFASVSYGYSITCHKAQGSNYKNVFVDFSDIVKNGNEDEMKRCTYVAISRTIDNLYILI